MLLKIGLENYRCYKKHEILFRDFSVVIGKNNAGKSTLIEAVRIIALVANRYKNLAYQEPYEELDLGVAYLGVRLSLEGIDFSFETISHEYNSELPSVIKAYFDNNTRIEVYLNNRGQMHAVIFNERGKIVSNKSIAANTCIPQINILPQIGPLKREEKLLDENYVLSRKYSYLSSDHFRNQLQFAGKVEFEKFKDTLAQTWDEVSIDSFDKARVEDNIHGEPKPKLFLRDGGFVSEVGYVGNGLQMWLQIIWFLSQCKKESTVILDEPDVYLHADIQRKLARLLTGKFKQVIIATHSVDIMSEVEPEDILIINNKKQKSLFADSFSKLQAVINNFGSTQNIELLRFWASKKVIFTENISDFGYLKVFSSKLYFSEENNFKDLPHFSTEGWSGWQRLIGAKHVIENGNNTSGILFYF